MNHRLGHACGVHAGNGRRQCGAVRPIHGRARAPKNQIVANVVTFANMLSTDISNEYTLDIS